MRVAQDMPGKQVLRRCTGGVLMFWCEGCNENHGVWTHTANEHTGAKWGWNGSMTKPTFKPSIFVNPPGEYHNPGQPRCHSYVSEGQIKYLNDCSHELAGQTVDLKPND